MQTTPVSDRVKAMLAQPRGVPQARKIARQTTGYANGGKVQKAFLGKFLEKLGLRDASKLKQVSSTRQDPLDATGQSYTRMRPEPTPEQTVDIFQQKFAKRHQQKGGVMEKRKTYKEALKLKDKDRLTKRDIERAEELTKKFGGPQGTIKTSYEDIKALHEKLKKETPRGKGKEKGKEHRKKLLDLMRKATGYAEGFITGKKKGGAAKKKTFLERRRQLSLGIGSRDKSPFLERRRKLSIGIGKKKGGLIKGKPKLATRGW